MKTNVKPFCLIAVLLSLANGAAAQAVNALANFDNSNGANPQSALVASGGALYGTTYYGGNSNFGTVFAVSTNGGVLTDLYSFNGAVYSAATSNLVSTDGANPAGGLVLAGNMLYGTTYAGGSSDYGTVFAVSTSGSNYAILHNFAGGADGSYPEAGLVLSNNTLYGTTSAGGTEDQGSIFTINTSGGDYTNFYSFKGGVNGSDPEASLVLSGNTLYGTTYAGGSSGDGTVFRVNTDGSSFSNVYVFTGGGDGANPEAGLVLSGTTLYGTAANGGGFFGTVFKVNTNGGGFASFVFNGTDGANPQGTLVLLGNTLLGTAANGGSDGWGTVFKITTSGSGLTNLYAFTNGSDGASPEAGLVLSGGTLYGTTYADDAYGYGSVFAFAAPAGLAPIPLNIALQGTHVTLTWSSSAFFLQAATNLTGTYTNVANATSPYTNSITNKQQFFRLEN
jgi:uncharacterized repeat protein (TIGR03803 family)